MARISSIYDRDYRDYFPGGIKLERVAVEKDLGVLATI